jgi:DNA replication ATP-dependent helicase Dna2
MPYNNILDEKDANFLFHEIEKRITAPYTLLGDKLVGLRAILETAFDRIPTPGEGGSYKLVDRMRQVAIYHSIPEIVMDELHDFREFSNQPAHDLREITLGNFHAAVIILTNAIEQFSNARKTMIILTFLKSRVPKKLNYQRKIYETVDFDQVVILAKDDDINDYYLKCESSSGLGVYTLKIPKDTSKQRYYGEQLHLVTEMIQPEMKVNLFYFKFASENPSLKFCYYETIIVLEPDYLVDASDLGKCFYQVVGNLPSSDSLLELSTCPNEVLMNKFLLNRPGIPMLRGIILGKGLAQYMIDNELNWTEFIRTEEFANAWQLIGLSQKDTEQLFKEVGPSLIPRFDRLDIKGIGNNLIIEPTIISTKYGLLGRLDFLLEILVDTQVHQRKVYEFKSGNPKIKPSDRIQTMVYRLLVDELFQQATNNTAGLIYLMAEDHPFKEVGLNARVIRNLIMARNIMAANCLQLAQGSLAFLRNSKNIEGLPFHNREEAISFAEVLSKKDALLAQHFASFVPYIFKEIVDGMTGRFHDPTRSDAKFSDLWNMSKEEKLSQGKLVCGLKIMEPYEGGGLIHLRRMDILDRADFRASDFVVLYAEDNSCNTGGVCTLQIFKATIVSITKDSIALRLSNSQAIRHFLESFCSWSMEKDFRESTIYTMLKSLFALLKEGGDKAHRFLGKKMPRFLINPPELDMERFLDRKPRLSKSQTEAIRRSLAAEDMLLIQGPPGTGKTNCVLADIVFQTLKTRKETIFLLAFTNAAVDNILRAVKKVMAEGRFGVGPLLITSGGDQKAHSLPQLIQDSGIEKARVIVKQTRVFVGTIHAYNGVRAVLPTEVTRDVAILDEASQITDPMAAGIFAEFKKVILIGDQNQLPPVSRIDRSISNIEQEKLNELGYENHLDSVFERLWNRLKKKEEEENNPDAKLSRIMLTEHFRMHDDIAALVNPYYKGKLKIGNPKVQCRKLPKVNGGSELYKRLYSSRVLFIESSSGENKSHTLEAERIKKLLTILQEGTPKDIPMVKSIGIITPWRAQASCILQVCENIISTGVRVDTVERFQGSECKNIILSLATSTPSLLNVLTSSTYIEDGLEIDRKLNVSISRAEERLIILGESQVLNASRHYKQLILKIKNMGGYISLKDAQRLFSENQ